MENSQILIKINKIVDALIEKSQFLSVENLLVTLYSDEAKRVRIGKTFANQLAKIGLTPTLSGALPAYGIFGTTNSVVASVLPDDTLPSELAFTIEVLKNENCIVQHGAGRGKAVFIPLQGSLLKLSQDYGNNFDIQDALINITAKEELRSLDIAKLKATVVEQQQNLQEQSQTIAKLQGQIHTQSQRTWG